jgi:hypothetical protein
LWIVDDIEFTAPDTHAASRKTAGGQQHLAIA